MERQQPSFHGGPELSPFGWLLVPLCHLLPYSDTLSIRNEIFVVTEPESGEVDRGHHGKLLVLYLRSVKAVFV